MSDNFTAGRLVVPHGMICTTPASPAAMNAPDLLDALRRGDHAAAGELLDAVPLPPDQLQSMGDGLMRRRRWRDAEWVFSRLDSPPAPVEMKRVLSRNFSALQEHRPEIYRQFITLGATEGFGIAASPSGRPTILARRADGSAVSLSGGADPLASAHNALQQVKQSTPNGEALALCGLGDGYLLQLLASRPRELFMDMQQAVFVLEPQPQVFLHALMIHDYAGPNGPIAAERFRLFVGPDWQAQLEAAISHQPSIGLSNVLIQQGFDGAAVAEGVRAGICALAARDAVLKQDVADYYAAFVPDFAPRDRRPRVMLVTTRFSTVLQYSTRDTADAFQQLGWDTHVLIEPGPSHRLYQFTMRAALAAFKPDVVFQIDHLRHEHADMFPPNLPFVCWAQDHLPNLLAADAGRRVGPLDFVLTDNTVAYEKTYGYPQRQLIPTTKLTAAAAVPTVAPSVQASAAQKTDDVVFVSNASRTAEHLLAEVQRSWADSRYALDVLLDAAQCLLAAYAQGRTVSTYGEIRDRVAAAEAARGVRLGPAERLNVSRWLMHPLNDTLYRQQALRWVSAAAGRLGLSVGLYGKGWDTHPAFVPHARGPVAYGEALDDLTRRAAINLQIVPFVCLHQRLLDGLAAGGFFLVRQNVNDVLPQRLLNFIVQHTRDGGGVRTTEATRRALPPERVAEFDALLRAAVPGTASSDGDDVVTLVSDWADAGLLQAGGGEVLPRLSEVSFDGAAQAAERLARFAADPRLRAEVAAEQRRAVVERLSYVAGMRRVQGRIAALLRASGSQDSEGVKKCA